MAVLIDAGSVHTSVYAYDKNLEEVFNCEINSEKGISSVDIGDLESYLFQSKCMKQLFKLRPGNKFIVIGGTAGMRELAEKDTEKVNMDPRDNHQIQPPIPKLQILIYFTNLIFFKEIDR